MRRFIILCLFATILFNACSHSHSHKVGEQMGKIRKQHTPYISLGALSAYAIDEDYLIIINSDESIQKSVAFTLERKCKKNEGVELIKNIDSVQFINMDFAQVIEILGQPHVDIGSGFYIPAYITEDAHIICFVLENETVFEIIKRDLLTNNVVERKTGEKT